MMSVATDIKTLLTGTFPDIFIDEYPDDPGNILTIYHTSGRNPEYEFGKQAPAFEYPTFQVRIRNTSAATALEWSDTVKDLLSGKDDLTINNHRYLVIKQLGDILGLGKDNKKRTEYSINFECQLQR